MQCLELCCFPARVKARRVEVLPLSSEGAVVMGIGIIREGTARRLLGAICAVALLAGLAGVAAPAAPALAPVAEPFEPTLSYYKCPPKSLPAGVPCAKEGKGGLTFNPRQKPVEVQRLSQRSIRSCPPRALTRGQSTRYRFEVTYRRGSAQSRPHDRASCPIQILPIDQ